MAVQFKFTGDDKDVQRALERMEKQYNALIATTKKGTDETKKMAAEAKKAFEDTRTPLERWAKKMQELNALVKQGAIDQETFGRAAKKASDELNKADKSGGGLMKAALDTAKGYLSVASAIALVNAQLEKTNRLNAEAKAGQMTVADAQAKLMRNMGSLSPKQRAEVISNTKAMATKNKQDEAETTLAVSEAFSAGATPAQALAAVNAAQKLVPERGALGERQTVTGAILDVAKLTKSDDAMANAGLIQAMGEKARVSSIEMTTKNLVPALGAMQAIGGGTPQENAAILAALTQVGDTTGAISGTAGTRLAMEMMEAYPEKDTPIFDATGKRKGMRAGTGLKTNLERLRRIQSTKETREKFLGTAKFEAGAIGGIMGLVGGPGTPTGRALEENLVDMPATDKAAEFAQNIVAGIESTAAGQVGKAGRGTASLKDRLRNADPMMAHAADVRDRLATLNDQMLDPINEFISNKRFDARTSKKIGAAPEDVFDEIIGPRIREFEAVKASGRELSPIQEELLATMKESAASNRESARALHQILLNQKNKNPDRHAE